MPSRSDDNRFSVRISRRLLDRLSGKPEAREGNVPREAPPATATPLPQVAQVIGHAGSPTPTTGASDRIIRSVRDGNLLLRHEADELDMIDSLAKELNATQTRESPKVCAKEEQACLDCYKQHAQEPLKCAEAARAYSQCAQRAAKTFVGGV
mmetsp:Transcript_5047/g.18384  ORF Transcript_5047/g.18384 Transcript_5047/m.18384 type:complete len:152 (+) Transcript_5047:201-656(+)